MSPSTTRNSSMAFSRRQFVQSTAAVASGLVLARGREADAFAREDPRPPGGAMLRLDSNENAAGPCAASVDAIRDATRLSHVYPFRFEGGLEAAIATRQGVGRENILVGCGSSEILLNAVLAFTDARRGLIAPIPTFEEPARRART